MSRRTGLRSRFRLPWRTGERIDRDIDEEISFHLDMRTEELVRRGMNPGRARRRAEREFGDVKRARRALRSQDQRIERRARRRSWLQDLRQDLGTAVRSLRVQPGFTAVAVGVLGLGIGASVGMFSVLNAVVLRPLPYPDPDRLVRLSPGQLFNTALVEAIGAAAPSLTAVTGLALFDLTLTGEGAPEAVPAQAVDPGFFTVFGVTPEIGRPFRPEERDPARSEVVILSHGLWQRRFGGDPEIVGRWLELEGFLGHETRRVIGVMPAGFEPPLVPAGREIGAWVPLHLAAGKTVANDSSWYVSDAVGRLALEATVDRAALDVQAAMAGLREEYGNLIDPEAVRTAGAAGLLDSMVADVRGTLWRLLAAVALVLLLACANLANLLLARGEGERRDLAVRAALGAGRGRLVRQQLARGGVLAAAGGALGLLLAHGVLLLLRVGEASGLPRTGTIVLDGRVLGFALLASILSVLAFGLIPAIRTTAVDLHDSLGTSARGGRGSRRSHRLNCALMGGEVALAVILVSAAALMLNSLRTLMSVDPGMDTQDVLAIHIMPPPNEYRERERTVALYRRVVERLAALPGVERVGAIQLLPFTDANWTFPYLAEGHAPPSDGPLPSANVRIVTPGYFEAVDVPRLGGRDVEWGDGPQAEGVALVNESFARRAWPGRDAIGREILIFGNTPARVIGVVGDVRQHALDREPAPELYLSLAQWRVTSMVVMAEGPGAIAAADAARRAVWESADDVPVAEIRPLARIMADSVAGHRFFTGLLAFFGLLALVLGASGVYGVMAYTVRSRVPEFGIRLALGATPARVRRQALVNGMVPVSFGLLIGLGGAVAVSRALSGLLYGVSATEPRVFVLVAIVLASVATIAAVLPAHRASRVDPAATLKTE